MANRATDHRPPLRMGLATAAALMRRLGGNISARNRAERAACFELTFVDSVQASTTP